MKAFNNINDSFRAAADIEADTPITVGATVGPEGRLSSPQFAELREWNRWADRFPLADMRRLKFSVPIGRSNTESILKFFDVPSPQRWESAWQPTSIAARQSQMFDARREAIAAWVREAEIVAGQISLADYDEAQLRTSLDELRKLTRERFEVGIEKAQQICSRVGVALVIVPELPDTRLSGCARWLSVKHALVGLTTRYKKDDQLWFTFFHEIGHILLHREWLSFVIDNPAEHLEDDVVDSSMVRYEREADQFASTTLIPPSALETFLRRHSETLTSRKIHDFADSIGIGPGLVVGRLQRDGILKWHQGNTLKQTVNWGFAQEN